MNIGGGSLPADLPVELPGAYANRLSDFVALILPACVEYLAGVAQAEARYTQAANAASAALIVQYQPPDPPLVVGADGVARNAHYPKSSAPAELAKYFAWLGTLQAQRAAYDYDPYNAAIAAALAPLQAKLDSDKAACSVLFYQRLTDLGSS